MIIYLVQYAVNSDHNQNQAKMNNKLLKKFYIKVVNLHKSI